MNSFNKAELPSKVYLSGADCFHLVLDKHAKKHGAGGNVMRKVFHFNTALSFEKINGILKSSPVIHWLCNIKLVQGLFQLPYWRYTDSLREIILLEHNSQVEKEIPGSILLRDITIESHRFIEADLIHFPSGACAFVLSWNHILLDAKGTTLLFEHLNHLTEKNYNSDAILFPGREKKTGLLTYINNMYKVKSFVQSSSRPPVSSVASGNILNTDTSTRTKIISFTAAETKIISANAFAAGSRFGPTLYFIACCSHVVHAINKLRNNTGDLWLPVPYDGRRRGASGPLISNCVSFLFYRIQQDQLNTVVETVQRLNEQMKAQIKNEIPQRYTMFLNMMRYVPLWLYYFLISRTGKGVFASFLYTSTGDNFNELGSLFGEQVTDLTMMPALTLPPGLTFVFLKHDDALNINIAYSPDIIRDNELFLIEEKLRELLLTAN